MANHTFTSRIFCELKTERRASSLELIDFDRKKATDLVPLFTERGYLSLSFSFFNEDDVETLKGAGSSPFIMEVKMWKKGREENTSRALIKGYTPGSDGAVFTKVEFTASTDYCLNMRVSFRGVRTQWSDEAEFTPEFRECCVWKEYPDYVDENKKYSVDEENPRVATNVGGDYGYCTIIWNTPIPINTVASWSVKALKSRANDGGGNIVGIAPSDINQNDDNNEVKCGWYFECYDSALCSGPPHNYKWKEYGSRKGGGNMCTQETVLVL